MLITVRNDWFTALIRLGHRAGHDWTITKISKKVKDVIPIEADVRWTEDKLDRFVEEPNILTICKANNSPNHTAFRFLIGVTKKINFLGQKLHYLFC